MIFKGQELIKMNDDKLVFIGKVVSLEEIPNADFVVSATVVCGSGGKWRGVVRKDSFSINDLCIVYLPDSIVPECAEMEFMKATNWRVKMRRFKGAPSEVVIMPNTFKCPSFYVGVDVTIICGVTKYHKPVPAHLNGLAIGHFPDFIPKTDEPNYQTVEHHLDMLVGNPYYVTMKMDGSSSTAYKYKGNFGVCSRNLELVRNEENGYWKMALKYDLENMLPEGYALQWETCGPGIQCNPANLKELSAFAFSAYYIPEHRYLNFNEFEDLCFQLDFPIVPIVDAGDYFNKDIVPAIGEVKYTNTKEGEGVVVRSKENMIGGLPISFKVINLGYER